MPLEIKELHIKVTVNQPEGNAPSQHGSGAAAPDNDKEAIIRQCVDELMEIMNNKKER